MKRILPVDELARDSRFKRINIEEVVFDPRNAVRDDRSMRNNFKPTDPEAPDASRQLMHAIFVGEIQALEGAGRTCWDFDTGDGRDEAPFQLKLDMARQCWDESRHVEISTWRLSSQHCRAMSSFSANGASSSPLPVVKSQHVRPAPSSAWISPMKMPCIIPRARSGPLAVSGERRPPGRFTSASEPSPSRP